MSKMLSLILVFGALAIGVTWVAVSKQKSDLAIQQHMESAKFYREKAENAEKRAAELGKQVASLKREAAKTSVRVIESQAMVDSNPIRVQVGSMITAEDIGAIRVLQSANALKAEHIKTVEAIVYVQGNQIGALETTILNMKMERDHLNGIIKEQDTQIKKAKFAWGAGGLGVGVLLVLLL